MKLTLMLLNLLSVINLIFANADTSKVIRADERKFRAGRAGLIAFEPFGRTVNVGLDILLPFVKFPTKRKIEQDGKENALLTINTVAVSIAGLISGFGIFIAHILKSITTLQGRENVEETSKKVPDEESESVEKQSAEHRLDFSVEGNRFSRDIEPFKFVYRNSSGGRVDTTFVTILNTIENTLLDDDRVDLNACIQKSICTLVKRSNSNVVKGNATALECIIDGIMQMDMILSLMRATAIEEAFKNGKSNLTDQCLLKYPTCHWSEPDQRLFHLLNERVRFL